MCNIAPPIKQFPKGRQSWMGENSQQLRQGSNFGKKREKDQTNENSVPSELDMVLDSWIGCFYILAWIFLPQ